MLKRRATSRAIPLRTRPRRACFKREEQEIRGEITEIASGNDSLTIKDENGMTHDLKLEDEQVADGVAVGDFVKAEIDGGTVVSLKKVDKNA
ncbi:MAG: hypothetical protein R3B51_11070 [Thermodesulfobacteriota bacterium]